MKRILASIAAAAMGLALAPNPAAAFPDRPIELVVAYSPGGTTDTIGRIVAARLSDKLGQPVVVENRPGATGQIGSQYVAQSAPDGYTLQIAVQTTHAVAPTFYGNIGYDPVKDFTPIGLIVQSPLVLITNEDLGVKSVDGLVNWIKSQKDGVSYATGGTGDGSHIASMFFNSLEGINPQFIPHQGEGPAIQQVIGGHLPYMFVLVPTGAPFVKEGQATALGVTGAERSPTLPDTPTMLEEGLDGFTVVTWWGIFGPAGMPDDVVNQINAALVEIMDEPETRKRITDLGFEVRTSTPEEFGDFVKAENERWSKVITDAGFAGYAAQK